MKIAIIYASTEGQTRKIAHHAEDFLQGEGHSVTLRHATDAGDLRLGEFDAVILAASVHGGKYQAELVAYAKDHASALNQVASMFLSVSLGAAGDDAEEWSALRSYVDDLNSDTGWTPDQVEHVAGAFKFTEYDFFRYWAMRWMESKRDPSAPAGEDREYTDWDGLDKTLKDWTRAQSAAS